MYGGRDGEGFRHRKIFEMKFSKKYERILV
jgi:hypothetical protein